MESPTHYRAAQAVGRAATEQGVVFRNLAQLALALGYPGITSAFLRAMEGNVGAFTRLAAQHRLPPEVGVAAKREYIHLMEMGSTMSTLTEGVMP
jgi:hypothetical protein